MPVDSNHIPQKPPPAYSSYTRKLLEGVGFTILAVLAVLIVWQALDVLLLIFAGILLGILLHFFKSRVSRYTRLPSGIALALVMILIAVMLTLFIIRFSPIVRDQAVTLIEEIPESLDQLRFYLLKSGWGREVIGQSDKVEAFFTKADTDKIVETLGNMFSVFSGTISAMTSIFFIVVIGIYIAAELEAYTNGIVLLLPVAYRPRGSAVLHRLGYILRWWLFGQSLSMLLLGTIVFGGLWLFGMPYAFVLALFAALMTFVPNLGPVIAYVPTALVALTQGPLLLIYVTVFFVIVQLIEGVFITPMVLRKAIIMPPVLILSMQVILFQLIGILGVILAMPIVACAMVLIEMIYIEGILGDTTRGQL